MKLIIKKLFCHECQKLVRTREQKSGRETQIICTQCGRLLYSWNGLRWKSEPKKTNDQVETQAETVIPAHVATRRPAVNRKTT